ncbi:MAG TPA: sigma factor [Candidatus Dormibacteraeota bacterium]|nr:sigma factor [Candidatus Dormibacteraeota bacterium]
MGSTPADSEQDAALLRDLRRQAGATAPLTDGEQSRLLSRSASGDRPSQDRLIAANLGMVIRLAEARGEKGLSVPDLVQEGSLGLLEAVRSFAASGEGEFSRFAEQKVGAQMDAAIDAEAAAVREAEQLVAAATDYERTELLLRRTLGRAATDKEIAEKLEWTVDRTRYVAQVVADARRRHDEELLDYVDSDTIDDDDAVDGE